MRRFIIGTAIFIIDVYDMFNSFRQWQNWDIWNPNISRPDFSDFITYATIYIWAAVALGSWTLIGFGWRAFKRSYNTSKYKTNPQ
jgi:hypothetical protein